MHDILAHRLLRPGRILLPVLAIALVLPAFAEFDERHTFDATDLTVRNLIGEVRVGAHDGSGFDVRVHVRGADASPELIQIDTAKGSKSKLIVAFPIDDERNYVYPALGPKSKTSFSTRKGDDSWLSALLNSASRRKVTVRGSGSGVEVWADVEILVPSGGSLVVNHGVGSIHADGVSGDLHLDNRSGSIEARGIRGDVVADTGAGHVGIRDVEGSLHVDTGSGHVEVENYRGASVMIDTGSGHVMVDDVDTPDLHVDTGSGHVSASAIRADNALIDTGSGEVELELLRMGGGEYHIDTGSGRVTVALPADASAEVHADTGAGSISVDLGPGVKVIHNEKDEMRFRLGDGDAEVVVDTGSGPIRFVQAE
jgi:hypothetical protein